MKTIQYKHDFTCELCWLFKHSHKNKNTTVNCMHDVHNKLIKEKLNGQIVTVPA